MNWGGGIRNIVESWSATTAISREYLRPARREKTQPGHPKKLSEVNLADTSRNHKTWLWLAVIYNWRVHSMKSRNFVIFVLRSVFHCTESRARIFKQGAWQVSDLTIRHPWFRLSPWVGKWCFLLLLLHCLSASFVSHWRTLVVCQLKGACSNVSIYKLLLFLWKLSSLSWTWTQRNWVSEIIFSPKLLFAGPMKDMRGLFGEKYLTRGLCLTKWTHPWRKLSTLLHAFYNPPGRPAGRPLGQADYMCISSWSLQNMFHYCSVVYW